jgi:hypothetical protein
MSKTNMGCQAAEILTCLLELVAHDAGFELRGVRGWASAPLIIERTGIWGAPGFLTTHLRNGRVLEEDVRAPGERTASRIYRITQHGADVLASVTGTWAADVGHPAPRGESRVLLRDGVRFAWEALCAATQVQPMQQSVREPDEQVWSSSRELTRLLDRADEALDRPPRWFMSEDIAWLIRYGFADSQLSGKVHRYRLTPAGASLRPLSWRELGAV